MYLMRNLIAKTTGLMFVAGLGLFAVPGVAEEAATVDEKFHLASLEVGGPLLLPSLLYGYVPLGEDRFATYVDLVDVEDRAGATVEYLRLLEAGGEPLSGRRNMRLLLWGLVEQASPEVVMAWAEQLPDVEIDRGRDGRHLLQLLYSEMAARMRLEPDMASAVAAYEDKDLKLRWLLMGKDADEPIAVEHVASFLKLSTSLGTEAQGRGRLLALAAAQGPNFLSWVIERALNGTEAPVSTLPSPASKLAYVRYKHALYNGDSPRKKRQKALVSSEAELLVARDAAMEAMLAHRNVLETFRFGHFYMEFCRFLSPGAEGVGAAELERLAATGENDLLRWSSAYWAARYYDEHADRDGRGKALAEAMIGQTAACGADALLADAANNLNKRIQLDTAIADMNFFAQRGEEALARYEDILARYAGYITDISSHRVGYSAAYLKGFVTGTHADGVLAFDAYLDWCVKPKYRSWALWQLANLYYAQEDFYSAYDLYAFVLQEYPASEQAPASTKAMAALAEYHLEPSVLAERKQRIERIELARLSGPEAVRGLLHLKGIEVALPELAALARAGETAPTLARLAAAASAKGHSLVYAEPTALENIAPPFIAQMRDLQYHLVTAVDASRVDMYTGAGGEPLAMARRAFQRNWSGKALTTQGANQLAGL